MAIGKHYLYSLLGQIYRVVLRVEMLDAPVGFVRTLGGGVKDLFYLPAKAVVRRKELGRGLVQGGASFARGMMLAPVRPAGKMAGELLRYTDRALAAMHPHHKRAHRARHLPRPPQLAAGCSNKVRPAWASAF